MQILQQKLYRLTAGLLVVWLAVFYPAMCDYHGLLLFRTVESARHNKLAAPVQTPDASSSAHPAHAVGAKRHHQSQHHDHAVGAQRHHTVGRGPSGWRHHAATSPGATASYIGTVSGLENDHTPSQRPNHHKPLAGESATAGLLSVLTPSNFALPQLQNQTSFVLLPLAFDHQYQHPPPDQPPRFSAARPTQSPIHSLLAR
jgi:hypothetical protein